MTPCDEVPPGVHRNRDGYGVVQWCGRQWQAPRLVWTLCHGPIRGRLLVLHHCDNPPCTERTHLYLGTHADNARDRVARGRGRGPELGEAHPLAVLTEAAVRQIRAAYAVGDNSQQALAAQHGCSQMTISKIVRRQTWRHI